MFEKNFDERRGDSPFETIWRQAKVLEYTASSILKRIRFLSASPSLAMTAKTPDEVDKTIESAFRVLDR